MNQKLRYVALGYIMGVPARDLDAYDLEDIAYRWDTTVEQVIPLLVAHGLYIEEDKFICSECGKEYVSYAAFHKHMLTHIQYETPALSDEAGEGAGEDNEQEID